MLPRSRSLLALTALAAVTSLSLTGCSKGGSAAPAGGSSSRQLVMWTHNAGNPDELGAIQKIVKDFNASQKAYQVKVQAFPQDSYNQSVTAAASSGKLPCILDIDGPNVPNWAWAGYLAPLTGLDGTLSKYLPSVLGKYKGKTYSYGYYDVALTMVSRTSTLKKAGIRIPTIDSPWTKDEFGAALQKLKASGSFQYPADFATSFTGEWWPYAYSPFLQSFGGDLINRSDYKTADGALNGAKAMEWAKWFRGLVTKGYIPLKSGADPAKDFENGKTGILYNGSWTAAPVRQKFKDVIFLPSVDLGNGPKIGGGSWQWGVSKTCSNPAGAAAYMKFASADKYVATVAKATHNIPATAAAAAAVPGYTASDNADEIFRKYSQKFAVVRPVTPGYPFIATTFTKAAQDILNGANPKSTLDQAVKDIDGNQKSNSYFN